jgi:hypothetical protein
MLSTLQYQTVNVVNGNIHCSIFLCWLLVRSTDEQDGSSRTELLSCLEDYKNGYYFFCVIPIEIIEQICRTSQFNNTGAINKSLLLVLDIKFCASKEHPEFKVPIM